MSSTAPMLLALALLMSVDTVVAGRFYRCDDGSRTPIYQTVACGADSRTSAQRDYPDSTPRERTARNHAAGPAARAASASRRPAPRVMPAGARGNEGIAAYACALDGEQWTQPQPCAANDSPRRAGSPDRAKPRQRPLTRNEVCRQVRDGSYRSSRGERPADSTYQRNLMRDRGGC